jgi:hypothetical protein
VTNQRGGSHPKQREDDGRTNNRPPVHPGRKPQSFTLRVGDAFYAGGRSADGTPRLGELWTVEEITRKRLTFRAESGETIELMR